MLVESSSTGIDHRILVVNGELIAAAKRMPGHVVGDGEHTIAQLVDIVNQDPRRGIGHEKVLTRLELDEQAERRCLAEGLPPRRFRRRARYVFLRSTAQFVDGRHGDRHHRCHPPGQRRDGDPRHPRDRARRRRRRFPRPRHTQSYKDVGGAICEVNAAPGFRMHVAPSEGQPRDVAGPVMDMLFPPGTPIPYPDCSNHRHQRQDDDRRMVAHIMKLAGQRVG